MNASFAELALPLQLFLFQRKFSNKRRLPCPVTTAVGFSLCPLAFPHEPGPLALPAVGTAMGACPKQSWRPVLKGKQHLLCLIKSFVSVNRLWQKDQRSRSLGSALEPWLCH